MSSVQEKTFLRLIKFSYDISLKVIRTFTKTNILDNYENSFVKFLEAHKHELYHMWNNNTGCCACPSSNPLLQQNRELNKEQFTKLYDITGKTSSGHFKKGKGSSVVQHCLCGITCNTSCSLKDLDIILIHTIITKCVTLSPENKMWLQTIRKIRNKLAHAVSTTDFDQGRLQKWWTQLEGSVRGLARQVPFDDYCESIEDQIKLLEIADLDKCSIQEIIEENKKLHEYMKKEKKISLENNAKVDQIQERMCQMAEELKKVKIKVGIYGSGEPEGVQREDSQCVDVVCKCTGENINEDSTLKNIEEQQNVVEQSGFDIISAEKNCIILQLRASPDIFQSTETLRQAIRSFIARIIEASELDSSQPCTIKFDFTFNSPLNQDELRIITSLTTLQYNTGVEQARQQGLPSIMCDADLQLEIESQQYCNEHAQLQVDYYCPVHVCICCNACLEERHKSCEVLNLDVACKDTNKLILEEIGVEINNINTTISNLADETKICNSDINTDTQNIESKIVQAKATVINQINDTETKLLLELHEEKRKTNKAYHDVTEKCRTISENLVVRSKVMEFIKQHGTEKQVFILAHHLIPTVDSISNSVSTIISSTMRTKLSFDEQQDLISFIPTLGNIIKSEQPSHVKYTRVNDKYAQFVIPRRDTPLTSFKLTSTFRTSDPVNITGMIVTEDNKLLLCNYNKPEILVYNDSGQYVSTIIMTHRPHDIAVIPGGDQYVVTLPIIKSIQYINSKKLTLEKCVKLPTLDHVYGIAADDECIYVGLYGKILVLDNEGSVVREIKLANFSNLYYLAVSDNNVYASDPYGNIYCIVENAVIRKKKINDENFLWKIIVDQQGYIYVGGHGSRKVYRLDKELKQSSITIGDDYVKNVTAISFNKNCTNLFIASERGETIAVFSCF